MSVHEMTYKCINIDFRFNVPCTLFRQKGAQILCFRGNFYCSVNPNYSGKNASVFSLLAIEEPEAHLHPNMQYRFLKYLSDEQQSKVDQIFITTHSPNITAAIDLDNIIVLQREENDCVHIAYPGRVFDVQNE